MTGAQVGTGGYAADSFPADSQLVYCWHGYEPPVVDMPLAAFPDARG